MLTLSAIQRLDSHVGFISGWTGSGLGLAETTDDGATWRRIDIPASHLTALRFIDANTGWAGGFVAGGINVPCSQSDVSGASVCYGVVLRTEDGGRSWQKAMSVPFVQAAGGVEPIAQLQAVDGQRAWVLIRGQSSEVRRTIDGGRTWTVVLRGDITAIRFASADRGWIAIAEPNGSALVDATSDGGNTWTDVFRTVGGAPFALDAATVKTAWLLTRDGGYCSSSTCDVYGLFRTDDGGAHWSSLGNPKARTGACAVGQLDGPLFVTASSGWFALNLGAGGVAAPGGLMHTIDGGRTWGCASQPGNTYLLSAADPMHVWVTSDDRSTEVTTLYSSDDGGVTWRSLDLRSVS